MSFLESIVEKNPSDYSNLIEFYGKSIDIDEKL